MKTMTATSFGVSAVPLLHFLPCFCLCFPTLPNQTLPRDGVALVFNTSFKFRMEVALNENLETIGVPSSVPVGVAHELLLAGHRYLDVRTPEEFSTGHVKSAVNIPYMYKVGSGMRKNSDFLADVSSHFRKDDAIIVGCQLGKRSSMATTDLLAAGFTGVTDIAGGYVAWTKMDFQQNNDVS